MFSNTNVSHVLAFSFCHYRSKLCPVAEFIDPVRELKPALKWGLMTPQKATLDSMRILLFFASYLCILPQFQFSLFAAALDMYLYGLTPPPPPPLTANGIEIGRPWQRPEYLYLCTACLLE
jgi:hypothetical protein